MPLTRRDFLKTSSLAAAWLALAACSPRLVPTETAPPSAPALIPTPPPSDRILHTLRRFTYGPTPEMLAKARRLGLDAYLEEQLHPESLPDDEVETLLKRFPTLNMTVAERVQLELTRQTRPGTDCRHRSPPVAQPAPGLRETGRVLGQPFQHLHRQKLLPHPQNRR